MGYEYRRNNDSYNTHSSIIGSALTIGIVGAGLYYGFLAVVFIGKTLFTAVVSLTFPAFIKSFVTFSVAQLSVASCLTVALEGVFIGLFIGCLRRLYIKRKIKKRFGKKHHAVGKSLISELLTFQVFNFETNLVSVILLNMLVGFGVGWFQGVAGTSGLIQAIFSTNNVINNNSIIGALIAGGAGTGNPFSFVLFIVIIFIVQGIIIGAATGLTTGILFGAISGAIKTGSTELLLSTLSGVENNPIGKGKRIAGSTIKGVLEGAFVGGIVGLIQGIITLILVTSSKNEKISA